MRASTAAPAGLSAGGSSVTRISGLEPCDDAARLEWRRKEHFPSFSPVAAPEGHGDLPGDAALELGHLFAKATDGRPDPRGLTQKPQGGGQAG